MPRDVRQVVDSPPTLYGKQESGHFARKFRPPRPPPRYYCLNFLMIIRLSPVHTACGAVRRRTLTHVPRGRTATSTCVNVRRRTEPYAAVQCRTQCERGFRDRYAVRKFLCLRWRWEHPDATITEVCARFHWK